MSTIPAWQYHEPDHPGADFDAEAGSYDRYTQKFRDVQREIDEVLDYLDLQPDQRLLEMGTGTGELATVAVSTPWTFPRGCWPTPKRGSRRRASPM